MVEGAAEPALPTVTRFAAKQAVATLRKHKIAVAPLLRAAGLFEYDFSREADDDNPISNRVSARAQAKFLDLSAEAMDDSAFGLHLAEQTDPRDAGILFYVASGAQTISEALTLLARYFRIVNEAVRLKLTRNPEGAALEAEFVTLTTHAVRQNAEFGLAVLLKALRELAGRNIRPTRVAFAHNRNSHLREFERFFGCEVEFGRVSIERASSDFFQFSNDVLTIPLLTADMKLLKALEPLVAMAEKERKTEAGTLRAAVENQVEKLLPHGKANAQTVAKSLALSVRTLSRRLAEEGTTYAELVDGLRRSLALEYVKEPGITVSEIAWLLGYEGSTSFNHAFRRWTGRSPSMARNEKQLPPPG